MQPRFNELHETQIVERSNGQKYITGYAAVFYDGTERTECRSPEIPGAWERIAPTAFRRVLAEGKRIECRYNHSKDHVLGSTDTGTLHLAVDSKGLKYEVPYNPEDPDHQKVYAKLRSGLIRGSSFAYSPAKLKWERSNNRETYWVEDIGVVRDLGPVNNPAFPGSTVMVRSEDNEELFKSYDNWKAKQNTMKAIEEFEKNCKL